jgi:hypothetical protein
MSSEIDNTSVQPAHAFEVFLGRRYDPARVDLSDSLAAPRRAPTRSVAATAAAAETPLQTYHRLRAEVDTLTEQIRTLEARDAAWLGAVALPGAGACVHVAALLCRGGLTTSITCGQQARSRAAAARPRVPAAAAAPTSSVP